MQPRHSFGLIRWLPLLFILMVRLQNPQFLIASTTDEQAFKIKEQAIEQFQKGYFSESVEKWKHLSQYYHDTNQDRERLEVNLYLAYTYQAIGQYNKSFEIFKKSLPLAKKMNDQRLTISILISLSDIEISFIKNDQNEKNEIDRIQNDLDEAFSLAKTIDDSTLMANTLSSLGRLQAFRGDNPSAMQKYVESAIHAKKASEFNLAAQSLSNAAMVAIENEEYTKAKLWLDEAVSNTNFTLITRSQSYLLFNIGLSYINLIDRLPNSQDIFLRANQVLERAKAIASTIESPEALSYAFGYLGKLHEEKKEYEQALHWTRRAVVEAQRVYAPEALYQWQWQAGRLLARLEDINDAIRSYRSATQSLGLIRQELSFGHGRYRSSLNEVIQPLYRELVDLLLQRADLLEEEPDGARVHMIEGLLEEARQAAEVIKEAELEDYFQDDCVAQEIASVRNLDDISKKAAIIYPILLETRVVLLVKLPYHPLEQFTVAVTKEKLEQEIKTFRLDLEDDTHWNHRDGAHRLYQWLVAPFAPYLTPNIETLVFVPDGLLGTIPFSALYDGHKYLIQTYATAVAPILKVIAPKPLVSQQAKALIAGLSIPIAEFPQLSRVATEVKNVSQLFPGEQLLNQQFVIDQLAKKMQDTRITILHIASHANFGRDLQDTFILTSDFERDNIDKRLTMNKLEELVQSFRFRENPLELLTLSACVTAAGDDRAALGLAGVAIKAGARSALATLWSIKDVAATKLISAFYRELRNPGTSKAVALQKAQNQLLAKRRFKHPAMWSPFLLINSWL